MSGWLRKLFGRTHPSSAPPAGAGGAEPAERTGKSSNGAPAAAGAAAPVPAALPPIEIPVELSREQIDAAVTALLVHFESNPPRLGSFPGTASRILQIFREAEPDFNRVVHELQQDIAVATKLLHVANSPFFGGKDVDDIRGAVMRIGIRDVSQIALGVAGQSLFEPTSRSAFHLVPQKWDELFHSSMSAAFATSWLSQVARVGRSDHAFLSGLLHDIGQPIALRALAQLVIEGTLPRDVLGAADEILDRVHVELGSKVTSAGGLPDYLCAAAAQHHAAEVPVGPEFAEVHLVRIIDGIAAKRRGSLTPAQKDVLDRSSDALALDPRWTQVAVTEYATLAAQVTRMFGVADPFQAAASAPAR